MVMIKSVTVNHVERNYFDDYEEVRSDKMIGVSAEKVAKAIDKLARRFRNRQICDCLFANNDDGSGWRLMYDFDCKTFDPNTSTRELRLRHYLNTETNSWDTEEVVTVAKAKRMILGEEA